MHPFLPLHSWLKVRSQSISHSITLSPRTTTANFLRVRPKIGVQIPIPQVAIESWPFQGPFPARVEEYPSLVPFGRSGLRPSLVRGDSPRNAPLTPLHTPPDVGSNAALCNQQPVAPPPWPRVSSSSPTPACLYGRVCAPPAILALDRQAPPPAVSSPLTPAPCPLPPAVRRSALRPSLVRGTPPATPPSKTIAHRQHALFPAVWLNQRGVRQPNTPSDSLHSGSDERLAVVNTPNDRSKKVAFYRYPHPPPHLPPPQFPARRPPPDPVQQIKSITKIRRITSQTSFNEPKTI